MKKTLNGQRFPKQNFYSPHLLMLLEPVPPYAYFPLFRTPFFILNYKVSAGPTSVETS